MSIDTTTWTEQLRLLEARVDERIAYRLQLWEQQREAARVQASLDRWNRFLEAFPYVCYGIVVLLALADWSLL